jgi:hypothetical protein
MFSEEKTLKVARAGQTWYGVWGHVNVNRHVRPFVEELVVEVRAQTLQGIPNRNQAYLGKPGWLLNGSYLGYTRSRKKAQAEAEKLKAGHYPDIIESMRAFDYSMDLLDESWGVADRGLGVFDETCDTETF